ncbi:MAG: hypothetical protein ACUZ8H_16440 [Candidatus Anammoxibacter sp.]
MNVKKIVSPENLLLLAVIGGAIYFINKIVQDSDLLKRQHELDKDSQLKPQSGGDVTPDGKSKKLDQATINSIAARQLSAMDRPGTDEETLYSTLSGLSANSLRRVFNAFKKVPYFWWGGSILFKTDQDLFGWYRSELSGKDLKKMQSIWDKTGLRI